MLCPTDVMVLPVTWRTQTRVTLGAKGQTLCCPPTHHVVAAKHLRVVSSLSKGVVAHGVAAAGAKKNGDTSA